MSTKLLASVFALCTLGSLAPAQLPLGANLSGSQPGRENRATVWHQGSRSRVESTPRRRGRGRVAWSGVTVGQHARTLAYKAEALRAMYARERTGSFLKKGSWKYAYGAIEVFRDAALRLHTRVSRRPHRPEATRDSYEGMLIALNHLERMVPGAYHFSRIRKQYRDVRIVASRLAPYYDVMPEHCEEIVETAPVHRPGWRARGPGLRSLARSIRSHAAQLEQEYAREKTGNFFKKGSWKRAQAAIGAFGEEAEHFSSRVRRGRGNQHRMQDEYIQLMAAWDHLEEVLPGAHHFGHVRGRYAQLRDQVLELSELVDVAVVAHEPHPRTGRGGRAYGYGR